MKLDNAHREVLERIAKRFRSVHSEATTDPIQTVADAILAIETYNRSLAWRIIEYLALVWHSTFYFANGHLDNMSIGRYQLKVSHILSAQNIEYSLDGRRLKFSEGRRPPLSLILGARNDRAALIRLMDLPEFRFSANGVVDSKKLQYFIEEYSRTTPSDKGFTYWFVARNLIGNIEEKFE